MDQRGAQAANRATDRQNTRLRLSRKLLKKSNVLPLFEKHVQQNPEYSCPECGYRMHVAYEGGGTCTKLPSGQGYCQIPTVSGCIRCFVRPRKGWQPGDIKVLTGSRGPVLKGKHLLGPHIDDSELNKDGFTYVKLESYSQEDGWLVLTQAGERRRFSFDVFATAFPDEVCPRPAMLACFYQGLAESGSFCKGVAESLNEEGIRELRRLAESGNVYAAYYTGSYLPDDEEHWIEKEQLLTFAAKRGHEMAMVALVAALEERRIRLFRESFYADPYKPTERSLVHWAKSCLRCLSYKTKPKEFLDFDIILGAKLLHDSRLTPFRDVACIIRKVRLIYASAIGRGIGAPQDRALQKRLLGELALEGDAQAIVQLKLLLLEESGVEDAHILEDMDEDDEKLSNSSQPSETSDENSEDDVRHFYRAALAQNKKHALGEDIEGGRPGSEDAQTSASAPNNVEGRLRDEHENISTPSIHKMKCSDADVITWIRSLSPTELQHLRWNMQFRKGLRTMRRANKDSPVVDLDKFTEALHAENEQIKLKQHESNRDLERGKEERRCESARGVLRRLRVAMSIVQDCHSQIEELEAAITLAGCVLEKGEAGGLEDEFDEVLASARSLFESLRRGHRDRRGCHKTKGTTNLREASPVLRQELLVLPPPAADDAEPHVISRRVKQRQRRVQAAARKREVEENKRAEIEAMERARVLKQCPRLGEARPEDQDTGRTTLMLRSAEGHGGDATDVEEAADIEVEVLVPPLPASTTRSQSRIRGRSPARQQAQTQKKMGLAEFKSFWERKQEQEKRESRERLLMSVAALKEGEVNQVDPLDVRFTHGSISNSFRSGLPLDQAIEDALSGHLEVVQTLPALELVWPEHRPEIRPALYSLSNRRLFLFRVLRVLGVIKTMPAILLPFEGHDVQRLRWDSWIGHFRSRWDYCYSTPNHGAWVRVRSNYAHWQLFDGVSQEFDLRRDWSRATSVADPRGEESSSSAQRRLATHSFSPPRCASSWAVSAKRGEWPVVRDAHVDETA